MPRFAASTLLVLIVTAAAAAGVKDLPGKYREWLRDVDPLITKQERKAFVALEKDYQRDAFIESFWEVRDPFPDTRVNEFRDRYHVRLDEARLEWEGLEDDRARMFVLNGAPAGKLETDCGVLTWPIEIWSYRYSERANRAVEAIFYQPSGGGPFRLWSPSEGHAAILMTLDGAASLEEQRIAFHSVLREYCAEIWDDTLAMLEIFVRVERERAAGALEAASSPSSLDPEWVAGFHAFSTEVAASAKPLAASFAVAFLGPRQSRTRVEGTFSVPREQVVIAGEGEAASYNFQLTGEVLRDDELFESFRYRFDLPERRVRSDDLALHFERALRPATYRWVLKLEDLNGGSVFREERTIEVPAPSIATLSARDDEAQAPPESEAAPSIFLGEPSDDVMSGAIRFTATVEGTGVAKVRFFLDGAPLLTKTRPPYSVELDVGSVPRSHTVRAVALAADGSELATDEMLLNPGKQNFVVRFVEPRDGSSAVGLVRARAEVSIPEGRRLDRLELFVGEERVATLYQAPFVQPVALDSAELGYLRVVGYLDDGSEAEDLVVVNSGEFADEVDVRLVELYAAVLDRGGAPVGDLTATDFAVLESGTEQELLRFEYLKDLPLYAGLLIDTSASMAESFEAVHAMGTAFLEATIGPRDRAAVIAFSEQPRLAAAFTSDLSTLSSALAGLRAERGTAIWDSLVFAVDYFRGIKGQKALVVLSDGDDRRSRQTFDEALRFAQSTGITVYTVALDSQLDRQGRRRLTRLAEETGGRSYFIAGVSALAGVYDEIQLDLRSRYLLAYQSTAERSDSFRPIEVRIADRDLEIRTLKGYFP